MKKNTTKKLNFLNLIICFIWMGALIYICFINPMPNSLLYNIIRLLFVLNGLLCIQRYYKNKDMQKKQKEIIQEIDFSKIHLLEIANPEILDFIDKCQEEFLTNLKHIEKSTIIINMNNQYLLEYDKNLQIISSYGIDAYHKAACLSVALLESVGTFFIYSVNLIDSCTCTANYNASFALYTAMKMCGIYDINSVTKEAILPYSDYIASIMEIFYKTPKEDLEKNLHFFATKLENIYNELISY
ncbi:unknown [Clostridium sp. CAG:470]|nr:MAG: hypothetical protein BHW03_04375 [Clostridium sp. 28_17]CDE14742.1 unknown [Clostridium sp. CAG:470]